MICLQNYRKTLLLLSEDVDVMLVANAVLSAKNRVLKAWNAESALWILRHFSLDSVLIHSGFADSARVQQECQDSGVRVRFVGASVESGILRLTMPEVSPQAVLRAGA